MAVSLLRDALAVEPISAAALPLTGDSADYDPILELVGDARFVLLGEATHGTHEFYEARAAITRRLIEEKDFIGVALEADWPDAWQVNRFVRGADTDADAEQALRGFDRFPQWMWRNAEVADFVTWLRAFNAQRPQHQRVGFYGLDLYSLHASMGAVIAYLDRVDPDAAALARRRYSRFEEFSHDPQMYGYAAGLGISRDCEDQVVKQLAELVERRSQYLANDALCPEDEQFAAEQNARVARNAEEYYRRMYHGTISSWNLRDRHMFETLEALSAHLGRQAPRPKIVVWAHNSHLGDARATQMADRGELNLGQLVRQVYRQDSVLIGFTTNEGTVAAASEWDGPMERKRLRPAHRESYEALLGQVSEPDFCLLLNEPSDAVDMLVRARLERAVGVVYRPESELASHYFRASLPAQFDAVIHLDRTHAVEPLPATETADSAHEPQTVPSGL